MENLPLNANSQLSDNKLSEEFIRKSNWEFDWSSISRYKWLSEDVIREFNNVIDWCFVSAYQKLSEDFIREFKDDVNWPCISKYQKLSEDFIMEFQDKVDWDYISGYQHLSEKFIREMRNNVRWDWISEFQPLTENFIIDFESNVNWTDISRVQKLSDGFISLFSNKLDKVLIEDSWNYKDTEFKKQEVISTRQYDCHSDYFIAYKTMRSDRYSIQNFQYQYIKGNTYETFCDCSRRAFSFGFNVDHEKKTDKYLGYISVPCKVKYEDVGRVIENGQIIRCSKIEILD